MTDTANSAPQHRAPATTHPRPTATPGATAHPRHRREAVRRPLSARSRRVIVVSVTGCLAVSSLAVSSVGAAYAQNRPSATTTVAHATSDVVNDGAVLDSPGAPLGTLQPARARVHPSGPVLAAVVRHTVVPRYAFASVAYNQWYARSYMATRYKWRTTSSFVCLAHLWNRESHWNELATNHRTGAHGIPQAVPGRKMATAGSNWMRDPRVQIRWGLSYINGRYGSTCGAWRHSVRHGWY